MKVIFLPYDGSHPYQRLLKEALEKEGVAVFPGMRGSFFPVLRSLIASGGADILHLHWINGFLLARNRFFTLVKSSLFICDLILCRLLGVKIAWTIHNISQHEGHHLELETFFNKIVSRLAGALIVHGPAAGKAVEESYSVKCEGKTFIVQQGNYISAYKSGEGRGESRRKLGLDETGKVFLFFGNLRAYKGLSNLIESFKRISSPEVRLVIAGKPYDEALEGEIRSAVAPDRRIVLKPGFIPDDEVQTLMNASDVVVLPYVQITTSGLLLLALSFGKPVLAPSLPYIREILGEEGCFMYSSEDPEGLFYGLKKALEEDLAEAGGRNYSLAKKYSWEDSAKKTREIYGRLLL